MKSYVRIHGRTNAQQLNNKIDCMLILANAESKSNIIYIRYRTQLRSRNIKNISENLVLERLMLRTHLNNLHGSSESND